MTTLRVLLSAPPRATRADAWALFDGDGRCVRRTQRSRRVAPPADVREAVLAARALCASSRLTLPPCRAARRRGGDIARLEGPACAIGEAPASPAFPRSRKRFGAGERDIARGADRLGRISAARSPRARGAFARVPSARDGRGTRRGRHRRIRSPRRRQRIRRRRGRCDGSVARRACVVVDAGGARERRRLRRSRALPADDATARALGRATPVGRLSARRHGNGTPLRQTRLRRRHDLLAGEFAPCPWRPRMGRSASRVPRSCFARSRSACTSPRRLPNGHGSSSTCGGPRARRSRWHGRATADATTPEAAVRAIVKPSCRSSIIAPDSRRPPMRCRSLARAAPALSALPSGALKSRNVRRRRLDDRIRIGSSLRPGPRSTEHCATPARAHCRQKTSRRLSGCAFHSRHEHAPGRPKVRIALPLGAAQRREPQAWGSRGAQ